MIIIKKNVCIIIKMKEGMATRKFGDSLMSKRGTTRLLT